MKQSIKLFTVFSLVALFLCQFCSASSVPTSSVSSDIAQSQYQTLMCSFGFDGSVDDIIYPDNYGGSYIDSDGIFVVTKTSSQTSRGADFAQCLSASGSYIVKTVSFSYNELASLKSSIDETYMHFQDNPSLFSEDQAELLNSITSFYISQKENCVVVGISSLDNGKTTTFYDMFGSSPAYILTEGAQTTTTASLKPGGGITSPAGSLSIGWPVYFYDDDDNVCKGFVSAGHAYDIGDSATINGVTVGVCVNSAFSGKNDAALIKITNPSYNVSDTVSTSGHTLSNTKYLLVSEGTTVYKVGSTSGYRTGTVTSTSGTVTYSDEGVTITDVLVTDAMNLGGDSGCVVYCKNNGKYYAVGSASGSRYSRDSLTESTFIECYVSQVLNAVQGLDCSYLPLS